MLHEVPDEVRARAGYYLIPESKKRLFEMAESMGPEIVEKLQKDHLSHMGYQCPCCAIKVDLDEGRDFDILVSSDDCTVKRSCDRCGVEYLVHVFVRRTMLTVPEVRK
jgi:transcription initiation factor IIE alpha subunit